jgi:hypothetical protein
VLDELIELPFINAFRFPRSFVLYACRIAASERIGGARPKAQYIAARRLTDWRKIEPGHV